MFKNFDIARDIISSLDAVNEVIAVGGAAFTGAALEPNIKKYSHWTSGSASGSFYHGIYNQNYSQSLATEILDVAFGYSHSSSYYSAAVLAGGEGVNTTEKNRVYKLFAKHLLGNENQFFSIGGANKHELIFLTIRRSQYKDELKKGTTSLLMTFSGGVGGGPAGNAPFDTKVFNDLASTTTYTRSSRGDKANLVTGSIVAGEVYYNAGVLVLVPELVSNTSSIVTNVGNYWSGSYDYESMVVTGGNLDNLLDGIRNRFQNFSFVNQSNLHSTFYFCRALNDEFNYSSNPTFLDSNSRIIPTSGSDSLATRTYITKVGLLGENNEYLAIASLSQPLKKTANAELIIKVRLDY